MPVYSKAALDLKVKKSVAAERARCAKLVPTTWLDCLLTGPGAPKLPLGTREVETLLLAIANRIRATNQNG